MRHRKAFISAGESVLAGSVVDARFNVGNKFSLCSIEARMPTHYVYGLEACG
jgi:hypothetical protein